METNINTWLDKKEYPFKPHYFTLNNINQHYIDQGEGRAILFVHGTPSWSFDFRNVINEVSKYSRCIALDHIGFGLSDKPEDYDYSTKNHSRRLEQFIDYLGLKDITLVLHDFGGPIGFDYAINHPENVTNIIVLNSWLWSSKDDPEFITFSKILKSPLLPFLYRNLNFSPRFLLPQSFGDHKLSRKLRKQYTRPFASKSERNGTLGFAKSLLNDQDWFEELWCKRNVLSDKKILFIWGMKDKFVSPEYLDKFASGFPTPQILKLNTCGHFPQEEHPLEVAEAIINFIQKYR